jgi:hypothetical protein
MRIEENIAHLQVTVDDALGMHVLDCSSNLDRVESDLGLSDSLAPLDHVHERPVVALLQNEIRAVVE